MPLADIDPLMYRGNYFAPRTYARTDPRRGVAYNRAGARVLSLTDDFLKGLAAALAAQPNVDAARVCRACGRHWGRQFAARLERELSGFHGRPLLETPMPFFEACLVEAFRGHGWGVLTLDHTHARIGVILATLESAPFEGVAGRPGDPLTAGLLAGLLGHFAGQNLDAAQPEVRARGDAADRFVVSLAARVAPLNEPDAEPIGLDAALARLSAHT